MIRKVTINASFTLDDSIPNIGGFKKIQKDISDTFNDAIVNLQYYLDTPDGEFDLTISYEPGNE